MQSTAHVPGAEGAALVDERRNFAPPTADDVTDVGMDVVELAEYFLKSPQSPHAHDDVTTYVGANTEVSV